MKPTMSMYASLNDLRKAQAKQYVDQNVWDGEDRSGCDNDSATLTPDELQDLVDDVIDMLHPTK